MIVVRTALSIRLDLNIFTRPQSSIPATGLALLATGLALPATGLVLPATGLALHATGLALLATGLALPATGLDLSCYWPRSWHLRRMFLFI